MHTDKEPARRSSPQGHRYVSKVEENDVQLGRGRPVITSEGNIRFRKLILDNKVEYMSTGRHAHKDEIARRIVQTIGERGGRFLRKLDSAAERPPPGYVDIAQTWMIVDEETSLEKVKQSLREQNEASGKSREGKLSHGRKRKSSTTKEKTSVKKAGLRLSASCGPDKPVQGMQNQLRGAPTISSNIKTAPLVEPLSKHASQSRTEAPEPASSDKNAKEESLNLMFRLHHPSLRKRDLSRLRRQQAKMSGGQTSDVSNVVLSEGPSQQWPILESTSSNNLDLAGETQAA